MYSEQDQAEDLALTCEVNGLEKELCSEMWYTKQLQRFRQNFMLNFLHYIILTSCKSIGYDEYVNYDSINYDCVETDEQVNNLLSMIEKAEKLQLSNENSSELLKKVSDSEKRRAIRKDQWNSSRAEFLNARTSFDSRAFE